MNGSEMILTLNDTVIAVARNVAASISVEAEEYDILPGTGVEDEEQWQNFRPGKKSWSIEHQGLHSMNKSAAGLIKSTINNEDITFTAQVCIDPNNDEYLKGNVHITELSIEAPVSGLTKFNAQMVGDDLPEIYP